jgi:hypothetical protein
MAPVTTPGKKVKASNVDRNDPKEILKDRKLTQYLNEANTMSNEAGKMEKDIQDMTQQELLSAIADEGDKARLSGKHRQPPPGDPSTWKFEGRTQELLDAYNAKFVPEEPYLADDVEHFCICNGSDDGRAMIECSNGSACLSKSPLRRVIRDDCSNSRGDRCPVDSDVSSFSQARSV